MPGKFVDDHTEMQFLLLELLALRAYNQRKDAKPHRTLLYSEGAVAVIALERLLRILPAVKATSSDTMKKLFWKAHKAGVIRIVSTNVQKAIDKIVRVRDTTLHADYEKAASQAGCDVRTYFQTQYTPEIDRMGGLFLAVLNVVDQRTGEIVAPPTIEVPLP
jgi:hypothetical protein